MRWAAVVSTVVLVLVVTVESLWSRNSSTQRRPSLRYRLSNQKAHNAPAIRLRATFQKKLSQDDCGAEAEDGKTALESDKHVAYS